MKEHENLAQADYPVIDQLTKLTLKSMKKFLR